MDQRGHHGAADQKLEHREAGQPEFAGKPARRAHVHQPGLHPALEPARALPEPRAEARRRFLVGGRRNDRGAIAEARQPHAEIGVLGHVVGVPGADPPQHRGAEMVRRAAERQRQPPCREPRQEHVEQAGIFGGEQAREPGVRGVVDGETGLHAGQPLVAGDEGLQREAELIGLRPVLRVVDRDESCRARTAARRSAPWAWCAARTPATMMISNGGPSCRRATASRVSWSSASRTSLMSSFSAG